MEKLVEQIKRLATLEVSDYWPRDWVLKLLALLFAVLLWYFVVGEDKVDTHVLVPVELVNLPRDMVVVNQYKQQLEVSLAGPRGLIDGLRRQNITRTINLSAAQPGTMAVRNDPETLPFPRGIEVLRVQPANITLVIDHLKEKQLPVEADLQGEPAPGHQLREVRLEPDTFNIRAPATLLARIDRLQTMPIDIDGLDDTTIHQVSLLLDEELLTLLGETTVSVLLVVAPKEPPADEPPSGEPQPDAEKPQGTGR